MNAANSETVLITGASSGIGLELARCFAADGCRLVSVSYTHLDVYKRQALVLGAVCFFLADWIVKLAYRDSSQ